MSQHLKEFESAWREGNRPKIAEFLPPPDDPRRIAVLRDLVMVDMEFAWSRRDRPGDATHAGESTVDGPVPRLEDYLASFPELGGLNACPLELIVHEYRQRLARGEQPSALEYQQRFRVRAEELSSLLADVETGLNSKEADTLVGSDGTDQAAVDTDPNEASTLDPRGGATGEAANSANVHALMAGLEADTLQPTETPDASSAPATSGDFGDYELLSEIARGGMGVVFKARQRAADRLVALKMILDRQLAGPEMVQRFLTEARAAANLDHPGIVPVYDVGEVDGQHYYSMGFIDGESLKDHLADGPLAPREGALLCRRIADAVAYAHERGILHRDLKPANILMDAGEPRVTDFGLAKRIDSADDELTATGQILGTPQYMPPEQAAGNVAEIGAASDVYSLGAVLYHMLVGKPPFQAASTVDVLTQVCFSDPVAPRKLNPAIDRDLETICLKCLAKPPGGRYPTSAELRDDLQRYLDGEPIRARRVSRLEKFGMWCRRRPVVAALLAVLVVGSVAAALIVRQRQNSIFATGQVEALLTAETGQVERIINSLEGYEAWSRDDLTKAFTTTSDPKAKLHVAMAMLPTDPTVLEYLRERLLTVSSAQFEPVRNRLKIHQDRLRDGYWAEARDSNQSSRRRFQAACALATFDPESSAWTDSEFIRFIALNLVRTEPADLPPWQRSLRGVRRHLLDPLSSIFRDEQQTLQVRALAADTLADYAEDDPGLLVRLLIDAEGDAFDRLFSSLQPHGQAAIEPLETVLREMPREFKQALPPIENARNVNADTAATIVAAKGVVAERFALCQTLPWSQFTRVHQQFAKVGYRPLRVRPYLTLETMEAGNGAASGKPGKPPPRLAYQTRVAAIWVRDGKRWELQVDLKQSELPAPSPPAVRDGLVPADLGVRFPGGFPGDPRFLVLWCEPATTDEKRRLLVDLDDAQIRAAERTTAKEMPGFVRSPLVPQGFIAQLAVVAWPGRFGDRRYGGIWTDQGPPTELSTDYLGFAYRHAPQVDLAVAPATRHASRVGFFQRKLAEMQKLPVARQNQPAIRYDLAIARFCLGQPEAALADLMFLVDNKASHPQAEVMRAWLLAQTGKAEEGRGVLDHLLDRKAFRQPFESYARVVFEASCGHHPQAMLMLREATRAAGNDIRRLAILARAASLAAAACPTELEPRQAYLDHGAQLAQEVVRLGIAGSGEFVTDFSFESLRGDWRFQTLINRLSRLQHYSGVWQPAIGHETETLWRAKPDEVVKRTRELADDGYLPIAIAVLGGPADTKVVNSSIVFRRELVAESDKERRARRMAAAATALVRLGAAGSVWPLLRHQADPRLRSYLIHQLPGEGVAPQLLARLNDEADLSARRALILTLGECAKRGFVAERDATVLKQRLAQTYADDPDPGMHGAAEWTLRQLSADAEIRAIRGKSAGGVIRSDRGWYVTRTGQQTMVVIKAGEFTMGSPVSEAGRGSGSAGHNEMRHTRRINRRYAIGAHELTVTQLQQFRGGHPVDRRRSPTDDAPANNLSWYDVAAYCNWLSEQEGIPREQWCFPPDQKLDERMLVKADYLERTGYRIATEAEWEYACRAGATTARHYGESERLLPEYAWFGRSAADGTMAPVGRRKPNDFGLFDMYGNASEWTYGSARLYLIEGPVLADTVREARIMDIYPRTLRGAAYHDRPHSLRSAARFVNSPQRRSHTNGFRVARTMPNP